MPSPSPTTTRAVKLNRRPPWTTLATRLIATTRSTYWLFSAPPPRRSSRPRPWRSPPRCPRWAPLMRCSSSLFCRASEGQAALTGGIGQGRDTAVVLVAGAVEDHAVDSGGLGTFGDELADLLGLGGLVTVEAAQVGLHARRGDQRVAGEVVDDLDADVLRRPGDDQARPVRGPEELLAPTQLTLQASARAGRGVLVLGERDGHGHLPAFPTLRRTYSPE